MTSDWIGIPNDISEYLGFTYIIIHKETGRFYIGKKQFFNKERKHLARKPTKQERLRLNNYLSKNKKDKYEEYKKKLKDKYKGNTRVIRGSKESDWKDYWGSSNKFQKYVKREGEDKFERRITGVYNNKFDLTYNELKRQLEADVLFNPLSYNEIINIRLRRKKEEK